jgi:dGTPase
MGCIGVPRPSSISKAPAIDRGGHGARLLGGDASDRGFIGRVETQHYDRVILLATLLTCQHNTLGVTLKLPLRTERYHTGDRKDQRSDSQRDRDRVLYCSAFRRLAEVTQVVSAAEGHSFHNRLTHTLKVAQIARRLAEKLADDHPKEAQEIGGPDPDIAETAALAHDLGHPPFGHIAEKELARLAAAAGEEERFEGNAQSFRIVTKLAVRTDTYPGLNLTAASLCAILKYPWFRATAGDHVEKWGVYHSEKAEFDYARTQLSVSGSTRSVEAEIMDWADDIAYSVFDVDDFYRAGLIPLDRIFSDKAERERFLEGALFRLRRLKKPDPDSIVAAFEALIENMPPRTLRGSFEGTNDQRAFLRQWTSFLVARYVGAIQLRVPTAADPRTVTITAGYKHEVEILKQLCWHYVIENPRLLTQQAGERRVIRSLFELFLDRAEKRDFDIFPHPFRGILNDLKSRDATRPELVRPVIDMISSMTENQAIRLYQRLYGFNLGSIYDRL